MKTNKAYFFITPALIFLSVFAFIPMFLIFYFSFLKYNVFEPSRFTFFDNYIKLFGDAHFWRTMLNSLIYLIVTPILIILSLTLALMVRQTGRRSKVFRTMYFLPVISPIVIVGIIWRWIFSEETGLMNYLLSLISIPKISWLSHYPTNIISVMILTIWRGLGYYMVIFLAGLVVISKEMEEAAKLDGANYFQQVFYILIPLLKPTITLIFVISGTAAIKIFAELYILIPGAPIDNKTLMLYLYRHAFERFDLGYGSAIGVILFLLTLGFSYINVKLMEKE